MITDEDSMSGHSHWAGIKHRKGVNDAKRAKVFTKLARPIVIAAREGGGNPETNFKLRLAIDRARAFNMPRENIDRAIERGTGDLKDGTRIEELVYEGFAPGNVALMIKTSTENKNRTVGDIKNTLTKNGGKFVPTGSVSFLFEEVGEISIETTPEQLESAEFSAIEAGARDTEYDPEESVLFVFVAVSDLAEAQKSLTESGLTISSASLVFQPNDRVNISSSDRERLDALLEKLNDLDDVDTVYDNAA